MDRILPTSGPIDMILIAISAKSLDIDLYHWSLLVHWIVDSYGLLASKVDPIETCDGHLYWRILSVIGGVIRVMKVNIFREKKSNTKIMLEKSPQCKDNVQSSEIWALN